MTREADDEKQSQHFTFTGVLDRPSHHFTGIVDRPCLYGIILCYHLLTRTYDRNANVPPSHFLHYSILQWTGLGMGTGTRVGTGTVREVIRESKWNSVRFADPIVRTYHSHKFFLLVVILTRLQ